MSTMSSASGQPGDPAEVTRTTELIMDDTMRFTPSDIEVNKGDTIRFFIKNTGTVDFACLIPGHLEAGMVGKVNIR